MGAVRHLLFLDAWPPGADLLLLFMADGKDPCKVRTFTSSRACYQGCSSCSAFHTLQIFVGSCIIHWSKSVHSLYLFPLPLLLVVSRPAVSWLLSGSTRGESCWLPTMTPSHSPWDPSTNGVYSWCWLLSPPSILWQEVTHMRRTGNSDLIQAN